MITEQQRKSRSKFRTRDPSVYHFIPRDYRRRHWTV